MNKIINNIFRVQYSILSPEEIIRFSTCEINNKKTFGSNTIYDKNFGVLERNEDCEVCKSKIDICPGHFGYIKLPYPIINKQTIDILKNVLNCICLECSNILLNIEEMEVLEVLKFKPKFRMKILVKNVKNTFCSKCEILNDNIKYIENNYFGIYRKTSFIRNIDSKEILGILKKIPIDQMKYLGFSPKYSRPENLILTVLPVLPISSRPFTLRDNVKYDDDLTFKYIEILKKCIKYNSIKEGLKGDKKKHYYANILFFHINTLFDNKDLKSRHINGRPLKCFRERLVSKDGLVRNNLNGKRTNFSARTVITPDCNIDVDEIGLPFEFKNLRTQEKVWKLSKFNTINENIIKELKNKTIIRNDEIVAYEYLKDGLKEGDIIEVPLKDGDYAMVNRQPSLHKMTILAFKVRFLPGKTIRLHLSNTTTFNADFDGDEQNIFIPQNIESKTETKELSSLRNNLISPQNNKPILGLVQDNLLGSFLLTHKDVLVPKYLFYDCICECNMFYDDIEDLFKRVELLNRYSKKTKIKFKEIINEEEYFTGRILYSILFPKNFCYKKKNNNNEKVKIKNGILLKGRLDKSILGPVSNNIIHIMNNFYSPDIAIKFLSNANRLVNRWLCSRGFTIGISDCILDKKGKDIIKEEITKTKTKVMKTIEKAFKTKKTLKDLEKDIITHLNNVENIGLKTAKNYVNKDNNLLNIINSGSKGSFVNFAQITGLVEQQNIGGERITCGFNNGGRTLPHFTQFDLSPESRGFIKHSYIDGLNPYEFFFHAMAGREGVIYTSIKTADSGYKQRRLVKILEDLIVSYEGSVYDSNKNIIQFSYGEDCKDGSKLLNLEGELTFTNPYIIANKLNSEYEIKNNP